MGRAVGSEGGQGWATSSPTLTFQVRNGNQTLMLEGPK